VIKRLDPRPGQRYNKTETRVVEPDIHIVKTEDGYTVVMNEDDILSTAQRHLQEDD
jgi:RNA polymerase sigma-54 factor